MNLGRLEEAVSAYDEAIAVCRRTVEQEGRRELANDLAMALMNRGNALAGLGQLEEAVSAYDEAIAVCRRLVEQEGRRELANDLARALLNKTLVLEEQQRFPEAVDGYAEAIRLRAERIQRGMTHLAGEHLQTIRYLLMTLLDLRQWEPSAAVVKQYLQAASPFFRTGAPPAAVGKDFGAFLQRLRALPEDDRASLYAALGEWAATVQRLIES
jgi:tetratricopeptide (TPR) repeat protein